MPEAQEWSAKLVGKNLEQEKEVKKQLPDNHRIIKPDSMVTRDYQEDRLNVHVDHDGKCTHCYFG
ncbi:hypothetical protein FPQ18DRAFT_392543 [Pyronema domesticum]|nr:hypothetical protein FPQ18DRAFT_392543 [Pyronema domesticum]